MSRESRLLNELQNRWICGEPLSGAEEAERLRLARDDALTRCELEFVERLKHALSEKEPSAREEALIGSVLEAVRREQGPRLRLVSSSGANVMDSHQGGAEGAAQQGRGGARWLKPAMLTAAALALGSGIYLAGEHWLSMPHRAKVENHSVAPLQEQFVEQSSQKVRVELVLTSGSVEVDGELARVGDGTLSLGQRVATLDGRACLTVEPAIDVCLKPQTELLLKQLSVNDIRLEVVRGSAVAQLEKRPEGHSFSLLAERMRATAVGTAFSVEHQPDRVAAQVTVLSGEVAVFVDDKKPVSVKAHNRLNVGLDSVGSPVPQAVGRAEEATYWAELVFDEYWQPKDLGVVTIVSDVAGASVMIGNEDALPLPLQTFLPNGVHRLTVKSPEAGDAELQISVAVGKKQEVNVSQLLQKNENRRVAAAQRDQETGPARLLSLARQERRAGNTIKALAHYRQLQKTYPGSAEAHTVRVTMGKLELDSGRPERALQYFDAYLRAGGALSPEALAGKIRALQALNRRAEERKAIGEYLRLYPNGFFAPALRQRQ